MIPLWFVLALSAAMMTTAVPLVQEKYRADGFALALWNKLFVAIMTLPILLYVGVPDDPLFYIYLAATAVIYSISDVVFFRSVPVVGSGVVTRLLPISVVATFFIWFLIEPDLWHEYMQQPYKLMAICLILLAFLYFAARLKKCHVSWQGVRLLWPVIIAACIGPVISKLALDRAGQVQAPLAYVCIQSIMMVMCLSVFYRIRKPISHQVMFSKEAIRTGIILAALAGVMIFLKMKAYQLVDNPGFVSLVVFTDSLWVILVYRLIGKKETANIWAGLGIVSCAFAVIVVKTLL